MEEWVREVGGRGDRCQHSADCMHMKCYLFHLQPLHGHSPQSALQLWSRFIAGLPIDLILKGMKREEKRREGKE